MRTTVATIICVCLALSDLAPLPWLTEDVDVAGSVWWELPNTFRNSTRTKPDTIVIRAYTKDLAGIHSASADVTLRVDRDSGLPDQPVLFVDYPSAGNDPAGRDVRLDAERRDWTGGRAIAFWIRPEHAMRFSVSFVDRNRVVYTAWSQLERGAWQPIRISLRDIRPNPYFQPPDARKGAPIDVSEVGAIGFAPQETASGRFAISQFVVVKE